LIHGIGTDIIEVYRIRKTMEADPGFKHEIFTAAEIDYCESKAYKYQHFAARFCAKEAFLKALGLGINHAVKLTDVEVYNDTTGQPFIRLTGTAKDFSRNIGFLKILVSLSHLKYIAKAVVIIEKEDNRED
jgi:holo-[acyl-carrier protein] synthase